MHRLLLLCLFILPLCIPHSVLANETVTLALFARGWAPYEMLNDDEPQGIAVDILSAIMPEDVTTRVEPSHKPRGFLRTPNSSVFTRLEAQEWVPEETHLLWTDPVMLMSDVLISPTEFPLEYRGPDSLKGKTIGCITNYSYPKLKEIFELRQATRYDVNKDIILLRMVQAGRVDAAVLDLRTAYWLIRMTPDLDMKDFRFSTTPVDSVPLRFVFNAFPGWEQRLPEINERIRQIRENGTLEAILSRYQ